MPKIKILYIITKSDIGGAQKYVTDLAQNLDKNLFETKILYGGSPVRNSPPHRPFERASAGEISNGIKWLSNKTYPWLLFFNDWLAILELIKIYKKEQPDIIHLNSSKAGVLGSLAAFIYKRKAKSEKRKVEDEKNKSQNKNLSALPSSLFPKIVFTAHGWVFNPTNALSLLVRWFYIFLHKCAALFQNKIICVSEYDYNLALYCGIAPKEKLEKIHNGIDPNMKFLDKQTARKEILMRIRGLSDADVRIRGLSDANLSASSAYNSQYLHYAPWVGSIGRLVKEKDYETFIKAAALIPNAYFFIIGSGPELKNLQLTTYNLQLEKKLFLIEPTGNDAKYLKAFDIFTMSSVKEGFPYILLEAMAAGLPIVVTEAGGMPEMIKNHENGLLVSQKNPEMLAKAIRGLIENNNIADELKTTAQKIVQEKFNLKQMIEKTNNLYKNISPN